MSDNMPILFIDQRHFKVDGNQVFQISYFANIVSYQEKTLGTGSVCIVCWVVSGSRIRTRNRMVEKETTETITDWLSIPANLFLKIIQMIIVPLIFASIIRGLISSGSIEQLQKLGGGAAAYFIITTSIALTIGITIATTIEPGNFIDSNLIRESFGIEEIELVESAEFSIHDIPQSIVGLVPSNPLSSFMSEEMLSIIIFALIMGVVLITLPEKSSRPILDLLESIQQFTMKVVSWAMRLAPFAAFGLMAGIVSKIGLSALTGLGAYMATVITGLFVMMIVCIIIIKFLAKRPLSSTLAIIKEPQLLAFSTSSSAAAMPVSIKTA